MRRFVFWLPLALVSCVEEIGLVDLGIERPSEVEVCLDISDGGHVKSSLTVDECRIEELALAVYRNGIREHYEYYSSGQRTLKLQLIEGQTYNMYIMANAGNMSSQVSEDEFINGYVYAIDSISCIGGGLPMAWSARGIEVRPDMEDIDVSLERLAAKVVFSLDKALLGGLDLTSVRLCQCASTVRPFKYMDVVGSRAESVAEIIAGDIASDEDLAVLNNGGKICFYTLENCQGVLLPDNGLPSGKLPEAIGDKSKLCTYLEVEGVFGEDAFLEGEVGYRFYLGLDACSSFDVPGNACIDVCLQLTDAGLREVSWRVDADVSVRDGYAWGSVEKGLHEMDELYVGERLLYRVEVSDEILSYVGGDLSGCFLWYDSHQNALSFTPLQGSGGIYTSEITCTEVSQGKLYLCGPDGERLTLLSPGVKVAMPEVIVAEYVRVDDGEPVEGLTYAPECVVNGPETYVYLYLTDKRRQNLNSSSAYGFDLEAFDFGLSGVGGNEDFDGAFAADFICGEECSGGYASMMVLTCAHDGTDNALATSLAEVYSRAELLPLMISERINGIAGRMNVSIGVLPVTLTLVDNGWAGYHSSQLSVEVENESCLPLEIIVCQMVDNNKVWYSSLLTPEIKEHVEQCLVRKDINYLTGSVNAYDQTMHVVWEQVSCVGGGVLPLEGIDTDDLISSLVYDGFGQDRMYHLVDVTAGGNRIYKSDISLVNRLSDGSSLYDAIYLSDRKSKGVWLYSDDVMIQSAGNYLVHYPNVSPKKIVSLKRRYESCPSLGLKMWHDGENYCGYATHAQGVAYGLTMTVRFYGEVQGYVRTDPKGIWGSEKDNYCTASFDNTLKEVPLADFLANVSMDGGAVKQAMNAIYAHTFEDKKDGKKYQHSAHPISVDCNVEIYVEGENGQELYPVDISWEHAYVQYYHAQDAVTYTCPMSVFAPCFNVVLVERI